MFFFFTQKTAYDMRISDGSSDVCSSDLLHAVWTLPPGDAGYAMRWRQIKGWFSRHAPAGEHRSASRIAKGERGIWQRRYWEHLVRDEDDLQRHVDYIHFNPEIGRASCRESVC